MDQLRIDAPNLIGQFDFPERRRVSRRQDEKLRSAVAGQRLRRDLTFSTVCGVLIWAQCVLYYFLEFPMQRLAVKPLLLAIALALGTAAESNVPAATPAPASSDVSARVKALNDLLAEQWEWNLKESPEFATILGDDRYNNRWSDASLEHAQQQKKDNAAFLTRFKAPY
jgi:hypothetical protein